MNDLRNKLIRLAHSNPELRGDLLPLLKTAAPEVEVWGITHDPKEQKPFGVGLWINGKKHGGNEKRFNTRGEAIKFLTRLLPDLK